MWSRAANQCAYCLKGGGGWFGWLVGGWWGVFLINGAFSSDNEHVGVWL